MCREDASVYSTFNGLSISHNFSSVAQRYMKKKRWKTIVRIVAVDIIKQRAFSRHSSADAQTNTETMTCTRPS